MEILLKKVSNPWQDMVAEFQEVFGQPVNAEMKAMTKEAWDFRQELFNEELREFKKALQEEDKVEVLDAFCDMMYITLGSLNELGFNTYKKPTLTVIEFMSLIEEMSAKITSQLSRVILSSLGRKDFDEVFDAVEKVALFVDSETALELGDDYTEELAQQFVFICHLTLIYDLMNRLNIEPKVFEEAFKRVHESNMSKVCKDINEALDTLNKYKAEGVETDIEEIGKYFIVKRKSDKKVLKSVNYTRVNLTDLV